MLPFNSVKHVFFMDFKSSVSRFLFLVVGAGSGLVQGCGADDPWEQPDEFSKMWNSEGLSDFGDPAMAPAKFSFVWPVKQDYGTRTDAVGEGWFRARRGGGTRLHAGVDLLYPVGQRLYSPCDGKAQKNVDSGGYGSYVVITCKLPLALTKGQTFYVDFLYGHLSQTAVQNQSVTKGQYIGNVGKSGNANSPSVLPHLHLEAVVKSSLGLASSQYTMDQAERLGPDEPSVAGAADPLVNALQSTCFTPNDLKTTLGKTYNGRVDPFTLLACLAAKPSLEDSKIQGVHLKWSRFYSSKKFDVNKGLTSGF